MPSSLGCPNWLKSCAREMDLVKRILHDVLQYVTVHFMVPKTGQKDQAEKGVFGHSTSSPAQSKEIVTPYWLYIDDNANHGDSSCRRGPRYYETAEEATSVCKEYVDCYLYEAVKLNPGISAEKLLRSYQCHGDDPYIVCQNSDLPNAPFSAWSYAGIRCKEIVEEIASKQFGTP